MGTCLPSCACHRRMCPDEDACACGPRDIYSALLRMHGCVMHSSCMHAQRLRTGHPSCMILVVACSHHVPHPPHQGIMQNPGYSSVYASAAYVSPDVRCHGHLLIQSVHMAFAVGLNYAGTGPPGPPSLPHAAHAHAHVTMDLMQTSPQARTPTAHLGSQYSCERIDEVPDKQRCEFVSTKCDNGALSTKCDNGASLYLHS